MVQLLLVEKLPFDVNLQYNKKNRDFEYRSMANENFLLSNNCTIASPNNKNFNDTKI